MRPTVLIVDDSAELRALVRARLEISGLFEVVDEASDGSEGWMLADGLQPDLVLLDTSMPHMDGLEALPLIRAVAPATQVVMFTGFDAAGLEDRARALGAADFIEKSLPIEELPHRLWGLVADRAGVPPPATGRLHVATAHDADAVQAQEALDEHLERYREVFNQAAIGMATLTLSGNIVRTNAALAEMLGTSAKQLVGVDYGALTAGRGDRFDAALGELAASHGGLVKFEHALDGTERTVSVTLAPVLDSKGEALYVFAQVQDITPDVELRRSEQMFRLLVTAVEEYAIYMLDPQGRVETWNTGAERIKGFTAGEIVGQHYRVFYPESEREARRPERNLELALANGSYAEEGWRLRKDGTRFWASVVITAVYDDAGRHRGFAKITRDQTQARRHDDDRRRATEQQAHLLAVTAHELRTPAAVVEGSVSLLREYSAISGDVQPRQLLDALATSARRLKRLVADLTTASDLHEDALALEIEELGLQSFIRTAVDRVTAAHPDARIVVERGHDARFSGDGSRLGQAIDNLLENALRHGRPPVVVTGEPTEAGVRICVRDAGSGTGSRVRGSLFERFSSSGPRAGTGLGLHLVREIVRSHGGEVRYLPPTNDRRTTFVIDLPAAPRAPALEPRESSA